MAELNYLYADNEQLINYWNNNKQGFKQCGIKTKKEFISWANEFIDKKNSEYVRNALGMESED